MNDPYHTPIIYIPLSVERMWLRLAKIKINDNNKEIKHGVIYTPSESGIVLSYT